MLVTAFTNLSTSIASITEIRKHVLDWKSDRWADRGIARLRVWKPFSQTKASPMNSALASQV